MKRTSLSGVFEVALLAVASLSFLPQSAAVEPIRVKVMTFNIRCDTLSDGPNRWAPRREWVADLIHHSESDFVGIQEALPVQRTDLDRMLQPDYQAIGVPRGPDGEAVPLYYRSKRWKLDPQQIGTFWLSETPEKYGSKSWGSACPRVVTWGRFVEQQSGRAIYVFNTHFDHISEAARQKAATMLAERIKRQAATEPVVLTGDLNSGENAVAVNILTGKMPQSPIRLVDTFRAARPDAKDVGTFHAFRGVPTSGGKIDYILVTPGAKVLSADILREHYVSAKSRERRSETIRANHGERYPSDHFPVTAEVVWP